MKAFYNLFQWGKRFVNNPIPPRILLKRNCFLCFLSCGALFIRLKLKPKAVFFFLFFFFKASIPVLLFFLCPDIFLLIFFCFHTITGWLRTKCPERGHSSGASLPATVWVSETPLQMKRYKTKDSSYLVLKTDEEAPYPWNCLLWFHHYVATATNVWTHS